MDLADSSNFYFQELTQRS